MKKLKDKCDNCGKFDYLKSLGVLCLCPRCLKEELKRKEIKNDNENK